MRRRSQSNDRSGSDRGSSDRGSSERSSPDEQGGSDGASIGTDAGPMDPQQRERMLESHSLDSRSLQSSLQSSQLQQTINQLLQGNAAQGSQDERIERLRRLGISIQSGLQQLFSGGGFADEQPMDMGQQPAPAQQPSLQMHQQSSMQPALGGQQQLQQQQQQQQPVLLNDDQNLQQLLASLQPRQQPSSGSPFPQPQGACQPVPSAQNVEANALTNARSNIKMIPCRARGMSMDHNFLTAYFQLSEKTKHGEHLVCSYTACRDSGVKFRYCAYCAAPVAKRNFAKRHSHVGEQQVTISIGPDGNATSNKAQNPPPDQAAFVPSSANQQMIPNAGNGFMPLPNQPQGWNMPPQGHISEKSTGQNAAPATAPAQEIITSSSDKSSKKRSKKDESSSKNNEGDEYEGGEVSNGSKSEALAVRPLDEVDEERKKRWANLLALRPSSEDDDGMSAWLMSVVAVSDFDQPAASKSIDDVSSDETDESSSNELHPPKKLIRTEEDDDDEDDDDQSFESSEEDQVASTMAQKANKSPTRPPSSSSGSSTRSEERPPTEIVPTERRKNPERRSKRSLNSGLQNMRTRYV